MPPPPEPMRGLPMQKAADGTFSLQTSLKAGVYIFKVPSPILLTAVGSFVSYSPYPVLGRWTTSHRPIPTNSERCCWTLQHYKVTFSSFLCVLLSSVPHRFLAGWRNHPKGQQRLRRFVGRALAN